MNFGCQRMGNLQSTAPYSVLQCGAQTHSTEYGAVWHPEPMRHYLRIKVHNTL